MNKYLIPALVVLVVFIIVFVLGRPLYIVGEREQVVVTRLNKPVGIIVGDFREDFEELKAAIERSATRTDNNGNVELSGLSISQGSGLKFKMPFIDAVERFPDTLLEYDADPVEIITGDKKKLVVDNFARWRIENPLLFRIRVRSEAQAKGALDDVIYSAMRAELGRADLIEIIRTTKEFDPGELELVEEGGIQDDVGMEAMSEILDHGREEIMMSVRDQSDREARERYGIHIIDVRIKRAELLKENLEAVFGRMRAERERISKGYRSEGDKEAIIIRGNTDRDIEVLLAEAQAKAERIRGEGDAQYLRTYAEAFGQNVELYQFIQSLEVMKNATPEGSEMIIGLDSSIYRLLKPSL